MKPNMNKSLVLAALLVFAQTNIAQAARNYELRAFYGDKKDDTVVVIDVKRMQLVDKVQLKKGSTPYPVDRAGYLDKVYAITRNAPSMDIIDAGTLENLGIIKLNHKPRSGEAFNSRLGLALIAGADIPITSVIDVMNDTVVEETWEDDSPITDPIVDYGGGNASGHPAWLTKDRFVVIDRARRLIQLWGIEKDHDTGHWELTHLNTVDTPTSVHHILNRNTAMLPKHEKRVFYALAEGKNTEETIYPSILKLRLTASDQLVFEDQIDLIGDDPTVMGAHHADFHPDGQHIYIGSAEGNLFVIDSVSKKTISIIETGSGTGHTRFIPALNMAIVTNHKDTFVTVINTKNHSKIKNITIIDKDLPKVEGEIQQSHTNYVSPDNKFYYAFASAYGVFFEINLQNLKVMRSLNTGGVPVQGSFINWDDFSYSATHSSSGM